MISEITDDNFLLYAARNYYSPRSITEEEFFEELNRFKYIKRLVNRYTRGGDLQERLILNHITVLLNVFGNEPGILMIMHKIGAADLHIIKPFLVHLKAIKEGDLATIEMDPWVVQKLDNI